jgi:hypothetical protein
MQKSLVMMIALVLIIASLTNAEKPPAVKLDPQTTMSPSEFTGRVSRSSPDSDQRTILSNYLSEDFEGDFPPTGWTVESTVPDYTWSQDDYMYYQGLYSAYCPYSQDQNERFVTPVMDFTSATSDLRVEFYWQADYTWMVAPYDNGDYELWISIDGGATWTAELWDEDSFGWFYFPNWNFSSVDLSAYAGESNVKLSWLYVASDANDVFLDFVTVTDDPPPPPPVNDNCVDVTPVVLTTDSTFTFTGDNTNATNDCEMLYFPEAWHAFTLESCMDVTIDYCGTSPSFIAYTTLADDCPCGNMISPIDYNYDDCQDGNATLYFRGLLPGTYYYPVMMDPSSGTVGEYVIHMTAEDCPPQPENDNCEDVTPSALDIGQTLTFSGTNLGATNDCDIMLGAQVWHAFTTTEIMDVTIDYCGTDPVFGSVYGAITDDCPCGSFFNYTVSDENACGDGNQSMTWYNLPPGTYYYPVEVDFWGGAEGPYTINISGIESLPAPANDLCENAEPIGGVQNMPFSTLRASADNVGDCIFSKDIWYVFTAPITGSATIHTCGSDFNTLLAIYEGAECDPLSELMTCDDDDWDNDCGYASRSIFDIHEGDSYFVQVGGYDMDEFGDGVLTIEYGNPEIEVSPTSITGHAAVDETDSEAINISNNGTATLHFDIGIDQHPITTTISAPGLKEKASFKNHQSPAEASPRSMMDIKPGFESMYNKSYAKPDEPGDVRIILEGGDDIASAEEITSLPYADEGNTDGFNDDYDESCPYESQAPDVVYSYSPESDGAISISLCGSDYDTKLFVYEDEATPGEPYACNEDGCGTWGSRSILPAMAVSGGHTYYIIVDGGWGGGDYELVVDDPIEPPANDDCADAEQINGPFPATAYGNNLGATIDCPGPWDMHAVWYKVDVPYEYNNLIVNYCETEDHIYSIFGNIFADCNDCNSNIYRNKSEWIECDDNRSNPELTWLSLPGPATYYIPVDFYGSTYDYGLTVDVTEFVPCEFDCPAEAIGEDEDCGDDNNGGCADGEYVGGFEDITCGTIICGSAWADDGSRDTDWYRLNLDQPQVVAIDGMGEFPFQMLVIEHNSDEDCEELEIVDGFQVDQCEMGEIVTILHEGEWYIWAGPSDFQNAPCDGEGVFNNEYYFSISCEPSWLSVDMGDGSIAPGDPDLPISVTMGAEGLPEGEYTGDILIYSDDPENSEISIAVSLFIGDSFLNQYLPGDANMPTGIWPPQVIGSDVTYLVGYFRAINGPCLLGDPGFFCSADANGDCQVIGSDVTRMVTYFRGMADLSYCPDYEPAWPTPDDLPAEAPSGWPNCETPVSSEILNSSSVVK